MRIVAHTDIAADGAVSSTPGALVGVLLTAAGATATLILYDNTAASGTVLCKLSAVQNTSVAFTPAAAIAVGKAIYADIGGTGANATVVYL